MLNQAQIETIKVRYLNTLLNGLLERDTSNCVREFRTYLEGYADAINMSIEFLESQLDRAMLGTHDMKNEILAHTEKELYNRVKRDLKYY